MYIYIHIHIHTGTHLIDLLGPPSNFENGTPGLGIQRLLP